MSTTFGISINNIERNQEKSYYGVEEENNFIPVAFRNNKGEFAWINDLGPYLDNTIKVYSLDNGNQGIYTIGDIKNKMYK